MRLVSPDVIDAFEQQLPAVGTSVPASTIPGTAKTLEQVGEGRPIEVHALPRDRTAIDTIAEAVGVQEGRGVSSKGAVNGLMPATARELGVDPTDLEQAASGRKQYLGRMYDRYGNWDDALAAFNWGPGNVDAWIKAGRPADRLPKETRDYVPSVLARAGLSETASTALVRGKRLVGSDEMDEFDRQLAGAEREDPSRLRIADERDSSVLMQLLKGDPRDPYGGTLEDAGPFLAGAARGMRDIPLGLMQTVGEQVAPETTRQLTQAVNDLDEQIGLGRMQREHPVAFGLGQVGGTVSGILAGVGMIPAAIAARVAASVPRLIRGIAGGAAVTGTTFHPNEEEGNRGLEAALGAAIGGVGVAVGRAVSGLARHLADSAAYQKGIAILKDAVGDYSKSLSQLKENAVANYERVMGKYEGYFKPYGPQWRGFEGFRPQELEGAIREGLEGRPGFGNAQAVERVREEMGLREEAARRAMHQEQTKQYEKAYKEWERENSVKDATPEMVDALRRQGIVAEPPRAPGPFEERPVSAGRFGAGMRYVQQGERAKMRDPQARQQMARVNNRLMAAAEKAATDHGLPRSFVKRIGQADKYWREEVAPIHDLFHGAAPKELRAEGTKYTNAWFHDQVSAVLRRNDAEAMARLGRQLGPSAAPHMQKVVEWEMLQALDRTAEGGLRRGASGAARISEYINQRREGLIQMLGRERVRQLEGEAHITERLMRSTFERHHTLWKWGTRSILPFIGLERLWEGMRHGNPVKGVQEFGILMTAPFAAKAGFAMLQKMKDLPAVMPLVHKAARLRPDSPELEAVLRQIESRIPLRGTALGRVGVEQLQSEPMAPMAPSAP